MPGAVAGHGAHSMPFLRAAFCVGCHDHQGSLGLLRLAADDVADAVRITPLSLDNAHLRVCLQHQPLLLLGGLAQ